MVLTPIAAASSIISTKCAGSRFTSSMYSIPLFALANKPGEKTRFPPFCIVFEKSRDPNTRSSVAPMGRLIKGVDISRISS